MARRNDSGLATGSEHVGACEAVSEANAEPNTTGGFNYVQAQVFNQNNNQWMSRVDYNISDNTKLFVRYNLQRETQQFPVGLWWRQTEQVPYPTPVLGKNRSDSVSASLTHVFSPSMTNEFVFGYTFIGFPNVFTDPSKVDRASGRLQLQGTVQERRRADSVFCRKRRRERSRAGFQSRRF